jgi:hypothetical protein
MTTRFDPGIGKATRFKKGQPSPNAGGRPKTRLLSEALRVRLAESVPGDLGGRTYAEVVADNLISIACSQGPGAVAAMAELSNRAEGKARQEIAISDITRQLREKSDAELLFHMENSRWPDEGELAETDTRQNEKLEE